MINRRYWLLKSEPHEFSIHDLKTAGSTSWEGVRNYQARNWMRDEMRSGDLVLFYHSNCKPPGVAGLARVCRAAYPDHTAFDAQSPYYDPQSSRDKPVWLMVDVEFISEFPVLVTLDRLRQTPALASMQVLQKGCRLSVQPVERDHFEQVVAMGQKP